MSNDGHEKYQIVTKSSSGSLTSFREGWMPSLFILTFLWLQNQRYFDWKGLVITWRQEFYFWWAEYKTCRTFYYVQLWGSQLFPKIVGAEGKWSAAWLKCVHQCILFFLKLYALGKACNLCTKCGAYYGFLSLPISVDSLWGPNLLL